MGSYAGVVTFCVGVVRRLCKEAGRLRPTYRPHVSSSRKRVKDGGARSVNVKGGSGSPDALIVVPGRDSRNVVSKRSAFTRVRHFSFEVLEVGVYVVYDISSHGVGEGAIGSED